MIDRKAFFDAVRVSVFPGKLAPVHVAGCNLILDECERRHWDTRWIAYALATTYHETAHTMQPVPENGRGAGKAYGVIINGKVYYGRGYVQLTWIDNYRKIGDLLKVDLVGNPELALSPPIAAQILCEGMDHGLFTGKKLADFFNGTKTDWENARRIINGLDRAALIAGYAQHFYAAMKDTVVVPLPKAPAPELKPPPAPPKPQPAPPGWIGAVFNLIAGLLGKGKPK